MTVRYALTRTEIVQFFLQGLGKSPKFLALMMIFLLCPGLIGLEMGGTFSRPFTPSDIAVLGASMVCTFFLMLLWMFLRGKTNERTLSVTEQGISTAIGSLRGEVPWSKVSRVSDARNYVLIVGTSGNAFFVPSRAFDGPVQRAQFIAEIAHWRKTE
jgi:hypothetical protein